MDKTTANAPQFSVVLPIKGGGVYSRQCVSSILGQSCKDFELLILGNNVDEALIIWLESIGDERITLLNSEVELSIEENWARILNISNGLFMTIIGHDDILHNNFLEKISGDITKNPNANLYWSRFSIINAVGSEIRLSKKVSDCIYVDEYFEKRINGRMDLFGTGFVFRTADYNRVKGIRKFEKLIYSDDFLFAELIGNGYLYCNKDTLFSYRSHPKSTCGSMKIEGVLCALSQYIIEINKNIFLKKKIGKLNYWILINKSIAWCIIKSGVDNKSVIHNIQELSSSFGRFIVFQYPIKRSAYLNLIIAFNIYIVCKLIGWIKYAFSFAFIPSINN